MCLVAGKSLPGVAVGWFFEILKSHLRLLFIVVVVVVVHFMIYSARVCIIIHLAYLGSSDLRTVNRHESTCHILSKHQPHPILVFCISGLSGAVWWIHIRLLLHRTGAGKQHLDHRVHWPNFIRVVLFSVSFCIWFTWISHVYRYTYIFYEPLCRMAWSMFFLAHH